MRDSDRMAAGDYARFCSGGFMRLILVAMVLLGSGSLHAKTNAGTVNDGYLCTALANYCTPARLQSNPFMCKAMRYCKPRTAPVPDYTTAVYEQPIDQTLAQTAECTAGNGCVQKCAVEGSAWVCRDAAGAATTVTQGTGATFAASPYGYSVATDVTDATAASSQLTGVGSIYPGSHTVLWQGFSTPRTNALQTMIQHTGNGFNGGLWMRHETSARCIWDPATAFVSSLAQDRPIDGFGQFSCNRTGTTFRAHSATGYSAVNTTSAASIADPGADPPPFAGFGKRLTAGIPLRGDLAAIAFYNGEKSLDFLRRQLLASVGFTVAAAEGMPSLATGGNGLVDNGGFYYTVGTGMPRIGSKGMQIERSVTNSWAADATAAATWTAVLSPTITSDVSAGPFSTALLANEVDTINDTSGTNHSGVRAVGTMAASSANKYTISCFVGAGTATSARLEFVTDGAFTGPSGCDLTLGAPITRQSCTATVTGQTFLRGQLLVGTTGAATGTINVAQCQQEPQGWASSPTLTNTARNLDTLTVPSTETATWPTTGGGESEMIFTLNHLGPADSIQLNDGVYFFDSRTIDEGPGILCFHYQSINSFMCSTRNGTVLPNTSTDTLTAPGAVTYVPGQQYILRFKWVPHGTGFVDHYVYLDTCADENTCTATTVLMSDTTGTKVAPTGHGDMLIGIRHGGAFHFDGSVAKFTVRQ